MLKIGQITMIGDNYGAVLQAYALQRVISKKFEEKTEIVKYEGRVSHEKAVAKKIRCYKPRIILSYFLNYFYIKSIKNAFERFRERYLVLSGKCYYRDTLFELKNDYDLFLCGSDMIWSEVFIDDANYYYLGFSNYNNNFAYAPSFGQNFVSEPNREQIKGMLNNIKKLSCREKGGCELVKNLTGRDAVHVIDPTALISSSEWEELINVDNRIISSKYGFAYIFDKNNIQRVTKIEKRIGKGKLFRIPRNIIEWVKSPLKSIGPIEFLRLFKNAEYIVTDTFHGVMFSLIYNKPFVVLKRQDKSIWATHGDRIEEMLKMVGLYSKYIENVEELCFEDFEVDYSRVNAILEEKRKESMEYLKEILSER